MLQRRDGWQGDGDRLLVEDPAPVYSVSQFRCFTDTGFAVAWCSGPDRDDGCPLAECGRCDLAAGADVILFGLDLADDRQRRVLRALRTHHQTTPVIVQWPRERVGDANLTRDCRVLPYAASLSEQMLSLRRALLDRGRVSYQPPDYGIGFG